MASITIPHYPNKEIKLFWFPTIRIDLHRSLKSHITEGETLPNQEAIKVLNSIRWQSNLTAKITRPVYLIGVGALIVGLALLLIPTIVAISALAILILGGGSRSFRDSIKALDGLSPAYASQTRRAAEYIKQLKANPAMNITLAEPPQT